ncbi:MAG: DegV family EDD domain-containing protein [Lachnospiraceae bacterium]|nr:DegV family EDD domain-containing protein [Lachnospiraceae bacterium]
MKWIRKIISKLRDPEESYSERTLIMMCITGVMIMLTAIIFDIVFGKSRVELLLMCGSILTSVVVTILSVRYHKIYAGTLAHILALVLVVIPVSFFLGGGLKGGTVFWIVYSYMFIGLALSGKTRVILALILTVLSVFEYWAWYYKPEWFTIRTDADEMYTLESLSCVLLVGLAAFAMLMYQQFILRTESIRAQKEKERAEELNRSQNQFFSSMSHEIRTPINSILGLNEIILRQEDASDEIRKDAVNIQGAGRMLLTLVNDILDVSKIRAGKMDIVPVNYKLASMMSEIVNMIWTRAEDKGLTLQVQIDPMLPSELFGDEVRIKQILINLLNNAIKYTSEGSVSLHVEQEEVAGDRVQIIFSVTDTGMGIKQDSLPYLFDAFQRMDEEKNRYIEGTGLGLSIVKQLIDLMDGKITVNSIYGQGSTFTVSLWQGITDSEGVGDITIESFGIDEQAGKYVVGFIAPGTRILIVDDNEMNLAVEKKLIADTKITIDTASSGADAIEKTLRFRYDLILMDHLMPEMDGIECMDRIRRQMGGLNNTTPMVVLTANAGSENKELYNRSGFDGYLIKPVSGRQLETALIKHLPVEKIIVNKSADLDYEEMNTATGYSRKAPVLIATSSSCDLPPELIAALQLDYIPFSVHTDDGLFWDYIETGSDELLRYMNEKRGRLVSESPQVEGYERFFNICLKKAHRIIYIAISDTVSDEYSRVSEAAKNFENVTVINSGMISSATGLLVMIACRLAMRNESAEHIIKELEEIKSTIQCSFVVADTKYLLDRGLISSRTHKLLETLNMRPSLQLKDGRFGVGHVFMGNLRSCYEKYIRRILPKHADPELDILFVTYVGIAEEDLVFIEEEIRKRFNFRHIIFNKASAAISLNCGAGTFGLLYMNRTMRDYHLSKLFPQEREQATARSQQVEKPDSRKEYDSKEGSSKEAGWQGKGSTAGSVNETAQPAATGAVERKWYQDIEGINSDVAIRNSGSEDAFLSVLRIFYDAIPEKKQEIEEFYENRDWKNYTIKVHALKSSAKLIGALDLSEKALKLEEAGKNDDADYITAHHAQMIRDYSGYTDILGNFYEGSKDTAASGHENPVADHELMESVYEVMLEAAKNMDCEGIEEVLKEIEDYAIPEEETGLFGALKKCVSSFDYDGIIELLGKRAGEGTH